MRLELAHPEFGRGDAHFAAGMDREIVMRQTLGDLGTAIKLDQVPVMLGLSADSTDRRALRFVPAALRFRRTLRRGDTLPDELFDGRPSWTPKPHRIARALRRLSLAIGAPDAPKDVENDLQAVCRELTRWLHDRGLPGAIRIDSSDIAQIATDTARVDWLCRAIIAVQQCLGALARTAGGRQNAQQSDAARATARGLRDAVVWASARAMAADQLVADPFAAMRDLPAFAARLWPMTASLRAFVLDIEPLMERWEVARGRRGGPTAQDFDSMLRLVSLRWADFDPAMFDLDRIRKDLPGRNGRSGPSWRTDDAE